MNFWMCWFSVSVDLARDARNDYHLLLCLPFNKFSASNILAIGVNFLQRIARIALFCCFCIRSNDGRIRCSDKESLHNSRSILCDNGLINAYPCTNGQIPSKSWQNSNLLRYFLAYVIHVGFEAQFFVRHHTEVFEFSLNSQIFSIHPYRILRRFHRWVSEHHHFRLTNAQL